MALYRCAACGSPNVVTDTHKEGYDYVKGAIGTVVLGVGGAVAGINGKTKRVYKCPDCGLTLNDPMPFEIKTLIDMGTMSISARENLKLNGVKYDWDLLKNRYKNIEHSRVDEDIATKQTAGARILTTVATATQEEFDWAVDTLYNLKKNDGYYKNEDRTYSVNSHITKQEYEDGLTALKVFIENLSIYLPPESFQMYQTTEYRGLKLYLSEYLFVYAVLLFYQDTGRFFVPTGGYDAKEVLASYPFIKEFVKAYRDHIHWRYDAKTDTVDFPVELPDSFFAKTIFIKLQESRPLPTPIIVPRFIIKEGKLGYWGYSYKDSPLRSPDIDSIFGLFPLMKDEYLDAYPDKKAEYMQLMQDWADTESNEKKAKEEVERKPQYITRLQQCKDNQRRKKQQISELQAQITLLEKKIFFKGKAQKQIAAINTSISQLKKEIEESEKQIIQLQKQIEESDAAVHIQKVYKERNKQYLREILFKMDYFIVWHWIEEGA